MSNFRSVLAVVLFALIGSLCLPTAGDAAVAASASEATTTRQSAVAGQRLVVLEMTPASGAPAVPISNATALATKYLGTSDQTTSPQAGYGTLTIRDDQGQVAWGIAARPVWLVTFHGVAYPSALGPQDCSCQANYWRPNTVVAVDATTGIPVIKLGVTS